MSGNPPALSFAWEFPTPLGGLKGFPSPAPPLLQKLQVIQPTLALKDITQLPVGWLKEQRIYGLVIDLDDTVIPHRTGQMPSAIQNKLLEFKRNNIHCVVITNNFHQNYLAKVKRIFHKLQIRLITHGDKPLQRATQEALRDMQYHHNIGPKNVAVVGDHPFLEGLLHWKSPLKMFIQVEPLNPKENAVAKAFRAFESIFVAPPTQRL